MTAYAEWLAARLRLKDYTGGRSDLDNLTEVALGCPCPPKPPPEPFRKGKRALVKANGPEGNGEWWVSIPAYAITPDEADAMACALIEHAAYAREQTPRKAPVAGPLIPAPICGRVLVGQGSDTWDPVCQKPNGHAEFCQKGVDE